MIASEDVHVEQSNLDVAIDFPRCGKSLKSPPTA